MKRPMSIKMIVIELYLGDVNTLEWSEFRDKVVDVDVVPHKKFELFVFVVWAVPVGVEDVSHDEHDEKYERCWFVDVLTEVCFVRCCCCLALFRFCWDIDWFRSFFFSLAGLFSDLVVFCCCWCCLDAYSIIVLAEEEELWPARCISVTHVVVFVESSVIVVADPLELLGLSDLFKKELLLLILVFCFVFYLKNKKKSKD